MFYEDLVVGERVAEYVEHLAHLYLSYPLPEFVTDRVEKFSVLVYHLNHAVHVAVKLGHVDVAGY